MYQKERYINSVKSYEEIFGDEEFEKFSSKWFVPFDDVKYEASVSGNMSEANFFNYIASYCEMEILVQKRNMTLGNVSTNIEEKLKNPPAPNASHMTKVSFIRGIEAEA